MSYDDIRTVDGAVYSTFREACLTLGFLDDDKEYVETINEESLWGTGSVLRNLFCSILISNSMSNPEIILQKMWKILGEDILYRQRSILQNRGRLHTYLTLDFVLL